MSEMYVYVGVFLPELNEKYVSKYAKDDSSRLKVVVVHEGSQERVFM